jgi:hypothetical protein
VTLGRRASVAPPLRARADGYFTVIRTEHLAHIPSACSFTCCRSAYTADTYGHYTLETRRGK